MTLVLKATIGGDELLDPFKGKKKMGLRVLECPSVPLVRTMRRLQKTRNLQHYDTEDSDE